MTLNTYYDTMTFNKIYLKQKPKDTHGSVLGRVPTVDRMIFSGPATIVFWSDGDKTIVKTADGDRFDAEKAFLVAFYQKMSGESKTKCGKVLADVMSAYQEQAVVVEEGHEVAEVPTSSHYKFRIGDGVKVVLLYDTDKSLGITLGMTGTISKASQIPCVDFGDESVGYNGIMAMGELQLELIS